MVTITVVFTTQLKAALGIPSEELALDAPARIHDVLQALRDRHGGVFGDLVLHNGEQLLPSILVCLGDEQVSPTHNAELKDGDVVTLLSAISGG